MRKVKYIIPALFAAAAMAAALAGCGSGNTDAVNENSESTQAVAQAFEDTEDLFAKETDSEEATELPAEETGQSKTIGRTGTRDIREKDVISKHSESDASLIMEILVDMDENADSSGSAAESESGSNESTYTDPTPATPANGFDRTMAEEIWSYVNAERTAAGLNALAWNEETYNFACQRAQAIVSDFSHNGCGDYGENILYCSANLVSSAYDLHNQWYNSQGHHENYMGSQYTSGACAVYYCNGIYYAVENFSF